MKKMSSWMIVVLILLLVGILFRFAGGCASSQETATLETSSTTSTSTTTNTSSTNTTTSTSTSTTAFAGSWIPLTGSFGVAAGSLRMAVSPNDSKVYVIYIDKNDYYKGKAARVDVWTPLPPTAPTGEVLSNDNGSNYNICAPSSGNLYAAYLYMSKTDMNDRYASVKKYDQQIGTWETFGTKVASGSAGAVGMQVYSGGVNDVVYIIVTYVAGNPYLFKSDGGGGWANLGSPSSNGVNPTLALSDDGTPYAAYSDMNNNGKIYLKKYSGGWVSQGGAISSSAPMDNNIALKIYGDIPYVAYCAYSVTNESWGAVKVKKYVSNSWQNVGSVADDGSAVSLDVFDDGSSDGVPYIAYSDQSNNFQPVVKMFNKALNRWDQVGGYLSSYPASTALFPGYSMIRVVEAGRPYVSYHYTTNPDPWALDKNTNAIVKKYE